MKKNFTLSLVLICMAATGFAQSADNQYPLAYSAPSARLRTVYNLAADNRGDQSSQQDLEANNNDIAVWPQIASIDQKVVIKNLAEPCSITIVDYTGRVIQKMSSNGNYAQVNHLLAGNYFVNITGMHSGNYAVRKLFVVN